LFVGKLPWNSDSKVTTSVTEKPRRRSWKHLLASICGGVSIIVLLWVLNRLAAGQNNGRLMNASFMLLLGTWPIFGAFFDKVTGTDSVWMPNSLGLPFALLFDLIFYSGFCYCILWLLARFREER
jgi:hypothetical protein